MHSARTGRILAVVVAVALAGALGVMWLRSGGDDVEVATAAQAEPGNEAEGDGSGAEGNADSDDSGDSDEPTPASADDDDPADSSTDDAAEGPDTEAEDDASVDSTDDSAGAVDDEPVDEPTEEPTDEATDAPDEEPSDEPTEDPSEDPNGVDEELRAELDELRTVGGPAEALVRAEDQEDIDNWLHAGWGIERFQPEWLETEISEWSNRNELWDDIVDTVWERAVDEYGHLLRDVPGTIWDPTAGNSLPRPAYGVTPTAEAANDYGFRLWVWVGVDPQDPDQDRPDAAVYNVQVIPEQEAPDVWRGELHRVISMCVVSGELAWDEDYGGQVWEAVDQCDSPDLANESWQTVAEIQGE